MSRLIYAARDYVEPVVRRRNALFGTTLLVPMSVHENMSVSYHETPFVTETATELRLTIKATPAADPSPNL